MLLQLLAVGLCLAEVATIQESQQTAFDFRNKCVSWHLQSRYFATCDGTKLTEKDVIMDERSTKDLRDLNLLYFENVRFDSNVRVNKINVKHTRNVDLTINSESLQELTVDQVEELILRAGDVTTGLVDKISLTNIKKLRLVISKELVWPIKTVKLYSVEDMDFENSQVHFQTYALTIEKSHINLTGDSRLTIESGSADITTSVLYIQKNAFLNVTADHFYVGHSEIYVENGTILINSKDATFSDNSLYGIENNSLSLTSDTFMKFTQNEILNSGITDVLSLNSENVIFEKNSFCCTQCKDNCTTMSWKLQDVELRKAGDTNYCYVNCRLTLNDFKRQLNSDNFCEEEAEILCHIVAPSSSTDDDGVTDVHILIFVIVVIVIVSFVVWICAGICHKDNRSKLKRIITQTSHSRVQCCDRQQAIVFNNDSYESFNKDNNVYEIVETPVTCK